MTEFGGTSQATAGRTPAGRRSALSGKIAGPLIDGTAEVTTRRTLQKSAAEIEAARRGLTIEPDDAEPSPARAFFGQRGTRAFRGETGFSGPRDLAPDLFSQAFAPSHFVSPAPSEAAERSILARARAMRFRNAALVVSGFLIGLFAVPALLLSTPRSPIAAPLADSSLSGLLLRDIEANIAPRGDGAVLSVAGIVANETATAALLPPLRIVLTGPGGDLLTKPLRAGIERLAPGQSVRFVSTLAVPAGMAGDVSVRFDDVGKPRP
ncbi:hypothetical protein VSX64_15855 [Aurantimonas sp. C2-6-R+9]|uniref:hypothetical protein n=1 Tax=unclassified Aurantimonas TaxID=2638230 RepID=UPI002E170BF3|nr:MULTISPECIES: hypothetical protein [unclassified Aurantimonas]MEC5292210.1 hypothetical protein [Aurantimonas sp. C2-3-R2]MEC5382341.1 hypothetical protein [Aurantimonas sp. C2-6-R+9]MEC5413292.1 hypothetical protein [Aurantimonas sp. C2-4-R8]